MLKRLRGAQGGDTIIEVLIVLAVLGLALSVSYSIASKSLVATRQSQENSRATELLRSQIETLRVYKSNNPMTSFLEPFCFATDGTYKPNTSRISPDCQFDSLYNVVIERDSIDADKKPFVLKATWEGLSGQGESSVTLVYRL